MRRYTNLRTFTFLPLLLSKTSMISGQTKQMRLYLLWSIQSRIQSSAHQTSACSCYTERAGKSQTPATRHQHTKLQSPCITKLMTALTQRASHSVDKIREHLTSKSRSVINQSVNLKMFNVRAKLAGSKFSLLYVPYKRDSLTERNLKEKRWAVLSPWRT